MLLAFSEGRPPMRSLVVLLVIISLGCSKGSSGPTPPSSSEQIAQKVEQVHQSSAAVDSPQPSPLDDRSLLRWLIVAINQPASDLNRHVELGYVLDAG
jgi:hypothetical protein